MAEISLADEIVARATEIPSIGGRSKSASGIMSRKVIDAGAEDYDIESYIGDYLNTIREERTPMTFDAYQAEDIDARVDAMDAQAQRGALSELTGATYYAPTKDVTSLATLMSFISGGESYGGSLDAANRGTINDKIIGSTKVAERDGKKLSEMTLSEIKKYQSISDPNNPDRLFAVGKFQMIPDTLLEAQKALGISDDAVFDEATQTQLGEYLFTGKANTRKTIDYLRGGESSLEDAMYGLAREFASMPLPYDIAKGNKKAGASYYDSGNAAKYGIDEVKAILRGVRGSLMEGNG
jgi:hypothetical protein